MHLSLNQPAYSFPATRARAITTAKLIHLNPSSPTACPIHQSTLYDQRLTSPISSPHTTASPLKSPVVYFNITHCEVSLVRFSSAHTVLKSNTVGVTRRCVSKCSLILSCSVELSQNPPFPPLPSLQRPLSPSLSLTRSLSLSLPRSRQADSALIPASHLE